MLFVLVQLLHDHGLAQLLETATGSGNDVADLLRLTALAAAGANTVNNLPAYLAMEPLAARWPLRMAALVGIHA